MKSKTNNKNTVKVTEEDTKEIQIILDKLAIDIQEFTVKALYTEHTYNGKKFSHKSK